MVNPGISESVPCGRGPWLRARNRSGLAGGAPIIHTTSQRLHTEYTELKEVVDEEKIEADRQKIEGED